MKKISCRTLGASLALVFCTAIITPAPAMDPVCNRIIAATQALRTMPFHLYMTARVLAVRSVFLTAICVLVGTAIALADGDPALRALATISPQSIRADMRFLADDLLEGRGTATRGHEVWLRSLWQRGSRRWDLSLPAMPARTSNESRCVR